ncbi:Nucleolar protein 5 [Camponotus floridanus]|uniref:Nucleolar protein 5 n=1 Tax=Camponotus floridanus TaxID=104421 RepID=E2B215_CAMFO|nr:nucleolar protein 58 [Camponotus floridanus]EFN60271.1 Nucleolar protein 5 [Camponotus floridanus]
MLVLFETPAGYAIFKLLDENKLTKSENLYKDFETPEDASKIVKLEHFHKFEDITEALAATTALVENKVPKSLKKALRQSPIDHQKLAVADLRLGHAIKDKLDVSCVSNNAIQELMRCIRNQMDSLITDVTKKEMSAMALGLAHSLSRYKLKFSPDKIDTMVIQAVCLLDDIDKELNNYIMRAREWYGWHFPELGRIVTDNILYIKTMQIIGQRENAVSCDLSDILPEDIEKRVKDAAETSMGSEISEYDAEHMLYLCTEILELHLYRANLNSYLNARMMALAPNLSILVGELVGARLISKAGSLTNLAKHPASTLQILGAEKALFRALKSKKNTPKYGLIYHSQLVGQSSNKNKGKISRMLAAKASLATRFDAFLTLDSNEQNDHYQDLGTQHRAKLEARLQLLESGNIRRISGTAKAQAKFEKYHSKNEYMQYSASIDSTLPNKRPLIEEIDNNESEEVPKKKKKKKHSLEPITEEAEEVSDVQKEEVKDEQIKTEMDATSKKKKKRSTEFEPEQDLDISPKKKKKRSTDKKIKTEDTGESSHIQEFVDNKKIKTEDTGESSHMQEFIKEEEDLDISPKKKKKRSTDHKQIKTEDTGESSGMQEAQTETDLNVSKKKKKKKMQESVETIETATVQTEETIETNVSVKDETSETNEGQKKKKRKKDKKKKLEQDE